MCSRSCRLQVWVQQLRWGGRCVFSRCGQLQKESYSPPPPCYSLKHPCFMWVISYSQTNTLSDAPHTHTHSHTHTHARLCIVCVVFALARLPADRGVSGGRVHGAAHGARHAHTAHGTTFSPNFPRMERTEADEWGNILFFFFLEGGKGDLRSILCVLLRNARGGVKFCSKGGKSGNRCPLSRA